MNCSAIEAGRPCSVPAALNTPYCGFHILRSIDHPMVQDSPEGEFFGLYPQLPEPAPGVSPALAKQARALARKAQTLGKRSQGRTVRSSALEGALAVRSGALECADDVDENSWPPAEFEDPIPDQLLADVPASSTVRDSILQLDPPTIDNRESAVTGRRRCSATTKAGLACPVPPRKGLPYCLNHEPGADTRAAAQRAARASAVARLREKPSTMFNGNAITLSDNVSIRSLLDVVIRLQLTGRLPDRTAANILRACAVASRTLDKEPPATTSDERWRDHHNYRVGVEYLLDEIDPLLAEAQGEHLHWTEVVRRTRTLKSLDDVETRYLHAELRPLTTFPPRTNELGEP